MHESPVQAPTVIQHWDGLTSITLSKLPDSSARLLWVFEEDHPDQLGIFVHLTTDEAQVVFDTAPEVGLLEKVRGTLADNTALIWHIDQQVMSAKVIELPRSGSESDLWEFIDGQIDAGFDRSLSMRDPDLRIASDDIALIALQAREATLIGAAS
ncbi:hypothetical protein [Tsukamurella pseudospumae]|nr:hypothetical protein [Tsukamurella pseudospumae]KXO91154.1 hypothetical protein AXK61_06170 [Tsukamurella pseudospumae]